MKWIILAIFYIIAFIGGMLLGSYIGESIIKLIAE